MKTFALSCLFLIQFASILAVELNDFEMVDSNDDNKVEKSELEKYLKSKISEENLDFTPNLINLYFDNFDLNNDTFVTRKERKIARKSIFKRIDKDDDQKVNEEEMFAFAKESIEKHDGKVLEKGEKILKKYIPYVIAIYDYDANGIVSKEEFEEGTQFEVEDFFVRFVEKGINKLVEHIKEQDEKNKAPAEIVREEMKVLREDVYNKVDNITATIKAGMESIGGNVKVNPKNGAAGLATGMVLPIILLSLIISKLQ